MEDKKEQVNLKVDGMSCTNCALTIHKYLEEQGLQNVKVNFIGGDVSFNAHEKISQQQLEKGIEKLGYRVAKNKEEVKQSKMLRNNFQRFIFCLVFTIPLLLHMFGLHTQSLINPYVQLTLTIPVYILGMMVFGKSAFHSLAKGIPNMNVLIALGATASFLYSLYGTFTASSAQFMFYESTATIITFIFLGNWLEDKSVEKTQSALKKLARSQKVTANMIVYDENHNENITPVESSTLKVGDLLLIKSGEYVPTDCKILWGEASVNESVITGESSPVKKHKNDKLIGGSIIENGSVKTSVTAAGNDTVMAHILKMVKDAQAEKPPLQQLADKISVVFVPVVVSISLITFLANYFAADIDFTQSLLRSIAVLVIACPCAMGLATPAAIAVGLGRAAKNGVLFKNAKSLEVFKHIKQVVFDKTGTLTTGNFSIVKHDFKIDEEEAKRIAYSLEKYSTHPIAKCVTKTWEQKNDIRWLKVEEIKGVGIKAKDKENNDYVIGSYKVAADITNDSSHNIYLLKNKQLLGWIDVTDELRAEAKTVISLLHANNIKTILLSGDKKEKCESIAAQLSINEIYAEQTPEQKLNVIAKLNAQSPVAMVGDGINDAPALAKATVGISLSDATQIAIQSAQVILMNNEIKNLPLALGLGKHTFLTIKQNLFWAFFYNVIAIPVAALGFLNPGFAALTMGFSDVVLAINSVRLNYKKVI